MNCREAAELISAWHDGELSPEDRATVQSHVENCASCAERLRDIRRVDELMAELPGIEVSPTFGDELARRLEQRTPVRVFFGSWTVRYGLAAAVLVIAVSLASLRTAPAVRPTDSASLPNISLLDDPDFLGIGQYNAGIGDALQVDFALSSEKEE